MVEVVVVFVVLFDCVFVVDVGDEMFVCDV